MATQKRRTRRSSLDVQKEKVKELRGKNSELEKRVRNLEKRILTLEKRIDKLVPKKTYKTKKAEERAKMLEKFHPDNYKDEV